MVHHVREPWKPIPDDVAHLTDIHDEDVCDAPSPDDALAALASFVGDAKIVAHNAAFDRTFTTKHPSGYPLLENLWIDSLDLARVAVPRMKSHRLIDLVTALGVRFPRIEPTMTLPPHVLCTGCFWQP